MGIQKNNNRLLAMQTALQEVKYQFDLCLQGFNDLRQKGNILLVICTLFITLPLSNKQVLTLIFQERFSFLFFILGLIVLFLCIIRLILILRAAPLRLLETADVVSRMSTQKTIGFLHDIIHNYEKNLRSNNEVLLKRQQQMRIVEYAIIAGGLFVAGSIVFAFIGVQLA